MKIPGAGLVKFPILESTSVYEWDTSYRGTGIRGSCKTAPLGKTDDFESLFECRQCRHGTFDEANPLGLGEEKGRKGAQKGGFPKRMSFAIASLYLKNLDLKLQGLARKRMIEVENDFVLID